MKVLLGKYKKANAKLPRKEEVVINDWDTYSMDHTLSLIVVPLLTEYRKLVSDPKHLAGVPSEFLKEIDVSNLTEEEAQALHEEKYQAALKEWLDIVDAMIWSFTQIKEEYSGEESFFSTNDDVDPSDLENKYDLDKNGLNDYYEKIDHGLMLFGRHYRSLWW